MQKGILNRQPWILFRLLGVDAVIAVYAWVMAFNRLFDVVAVPFEPIFLLCISAWILLTISRLIHIVTLGEKDSDRWVAGFFRSHIFPVSLILLCAFLSVFWLALYQVGVNFLQLLVLPAICWLYSVSFPAVLWGWGRTIARSWAFAMACSAPAWLYCMDGTVIEILFFQPTMALTVLMTLFIFFRKINAVTSSERVGRIADFLPFGVFALVFYCILEASRCVPHERSFYYAVAVGAAFLQILSHLKTRLSKEEIAALGWPLLALSATVACFLS